MSYDDLGYGDINVFFQNGKIKTPHIDQLANEGMIFTDAHTSSSVCTPTRYGILTWGFIFNLVSKTQFHIYLVKDDLGSPKSSLFLYLNSSPSNMSSFSIDFF